jgi:hypothetical protein
MATNYVGAYLNTTRVSRGWSFGQLARAVGAVTPKQTSRIAQRLVAFERQGVRDRKLLQKVVAALDLDATIINEQLRRQRAEELTEWTAWADEPVPIELHVIPFPGFAFRQQLPDDIAADEKRSIDFAKRMTKGRHGIRVVVALDRRRSLTFARGEIVATRDASPNVSVTPFVTIGGQRVLFHATGDDQSR